MEKIKIKYLILILPVILTGCSALTKFTGKNPKYLNWEQTVKLTPEFNSLEWKNAKADIAFGSQKFSSPINTKILLDSVIHISATPFFGMEMFKVELEKSKINLFDKVNKRMYELEFNKIDSLSGSSYIFENLQDIFSNRPFVYAPNPNYKMKKSVRNDSVFWTMERPSSNQIISLDKNGRMISAIVKSNSADREILIEYSEFNKWDNKLFPEQISIKLKNKSLNIGIHLKLSKIIFDNQINLKREQTEKFIKVPISTLL